MKPNVLVALSLLIIASTVLSYGQLREYPDASLIGLKGVRVVVDYQGPVEESYGLTESELQAAVELRLNADNVKVLDEKAWQREPGKPYLYINVVGTQVGSEKSPTYFYSFTADLIQEISLTRQPSDRTDGATWSQGYTLVVSRDNLREVTLKIGDVAHDFAVSVQEANK
jgi:hypothetical protein